MPSYANRRPTSRPRHRDASDRDAPRSPLKATHRTRHTTRRMGEQNGKPFVEVVETTEEVTRSRPSPPSLQRAAAPRSGTQPPRMSDATDSDDCPRLAYQDNDRASGHHPNTSSGGRVSGRVSGRDTPRSGVVGTVNSTRHMSVTSRGRTPQALPSTPPRSQPESSTSRRRHLDGTQRPTRAIGLVESPADINALDDYDTPTRHHRGDGRYVYDYGNGYNADAPARSGHHRSSNDVADPRANARPRPGSVMGSKDNGSNSRTDAGAYTGDAAAASMGPFHFRVRIHECRGLFDDLRDAHRAAPAVYFALHTAEKRGHTGVTEAGAFDPVFNDEFIFTSADPERDALVCTLVTAATSSQRREKKVAECVLALHKLAWQTERAVWVPLVRHPGTEQAYEQGEVRVSIYSEDYGYDEVAPEEVEAACSTAIHSALLRYAPKELHRLDWLTAAYVDKSPKEWEQLQASYRARTVEPVPVTMTVLRVDGLMDDAGRPVGACDVYVVADDGHTELRSKAAPYRHRASFNQEFNLTLVNPEVDTMSVTVYGNGRKLGEAVVGLTNVRAGTAKEVTLMLVRAAETGDASNGGQLVLTLLTQKYNSPYPMTARDEAKLRDRVRNFLWCYLRDDLHRLDAIVGSIDNEDVYMREWARTIGPERTPKLLTLNVREATNIGAAGNGMAPRCYVRVCVGPETLRTELAVSRNNAVTFKTPLRVPVYDPTKDAVELMLIADGDDGEREISRVTFGVNNLPQGRRVVRTLHLVAEALKRTARVQGEAAVELMAEDFGNTGAGADAAVTKIFSANSPHVQRLEGITQRSSPEKLHRVPFMLDTAPLDEVERVVEDEAKQHAADVAVAPMTVRILGVRAFKPATDFYVKVYLNNESILRTEDVKGGAEVMLNIDDNNERTLRLGNAAQSLMSFKIARHRTLMKSAVLGEAEVALSTLIRGEKNVLWLPFFRASASSSPAKKKSVSCTASKPEQSVKVKGNHMPQTTNGAVNGGGSAGQRAHQQQGSGAAHEDAAITRHGGASPVGFLGVELQSMAFPNTTVTEYIIKNDSGTKSVPAQTVVTSDVTSLVAKMRPSELSKVQPMIAQCSSLKDAHAELRAQLSPAPIAGTVYVQIHSVELTSPEGQTQESQGGIYVEASFGSERQVSRKQVDLTSGAGRSRVRYAQMRLDIPDSAVSRTKGSKTDSIGVPALELRLVGGQPRGMTGDAGNSRKGAAAAGGNAYAEISNEAGGAESGYPYETIDNGSDATADSHYVGGENNINSYLKSPKHHGRRWGIKQPDEERMGRPSKMLISQQQQQQQQQQRGQGQSYSGTTSPARGGGGSTHESTGPTWRWGASSAFSNAGYYRSPPPPQQPHSEVPEANSEKNYLGGVNNIRSYVDSPSRSNSRHQSPGPQDRHRQQDLHKDNGSRAASPSPAPGVAGGHGRPYRGEIGLVRLSLRALLTTPLYKLGDTLRVPIIAPAVPSSLSYQERHSPDVNERCIVGHVTLRITLPAFEHIAESLRLGSRHMMANVAPDYVHYYERRIGAYLRARSAPDLVSFHYNLYERDIASGRWPVSLYDWMQSLLKRFGAETVNFGPEPPLPFDPEEWERARLRDEALRREREAAFASSEQGGSGSDRNSEAGLYSPRVGPAADAAPRRSTESSKAPAEVTYSF